MAAIYTGRASRSFMNSDRVYEEFMGQPVEGDQPAVQLLANLFAVYEFGYGIFMMCLQGQDQYRALSMTIQMSAIIHMIFAAIVWRHGAPRGKVYANLAIAAVFGLWYYWGVNSPEVMEGNYVTVKCAKPQGC
ncbi:hypothetical protein BDV12DRAFT_178828 [Aspergillus spectabilis]